ncbi:uncharacterized protein ASPGLDRAFT_57489 [Aspergillus glaucus CBS 516.65]|uniref:Uncharacterized protein n=1 Tax=Aspergillus glaucus CBS 516.65 TaxID=1160497 RepID=A0A1L9VNB0_ASPGL|nr:hypothetical protein ASPGLDRAFT_57489 [Aspergillus glaucus CBS 516.65]OJJ85362.1 hypothetical protein ASPGLDRAFT_57489 [Aspergillus glaucus CBS 516.65]
MVYGTQNEDPERGEYRSLYSDQDGDDTPSTTPLYTHPSTAPNANNPEFMSKPNPRRRSWIQFQQNLRLPTSTEVSTIAKAVFGALGFIIGILVCTLAIITLIYGCTEVVNSIRHVDDPSPYRRLSDYQGYVAVEDDIDDPYPYPYSYPLTDGGGDVDTAPKAMTTKSGIEVACFGEAGTCEASLSELMRIPQATRVAVITDGEAWSDITGEDLDGDVDIDGDGDGDEGEFPDELACGNMWMEEDEGVVVDELEYVSMLDRLWNGLFGG